MSEPWILNFFKHVAQLINKQTQGSRPTDCATSPLGKLLEMHGTQMKQLLITQRSLQSMPRSFMFVVRKQSRNEGGQPGNCSL